MMTDSLQNSMIADSAAVDAVVEPVKMDLSVRTDSLPQTILKGDTFEFKVDISWQAPAGQSAVLILPASSANAKGITQLGVREEHFRKVLGDKSVSHTRFIWTLSADDTGTVSIPALRFQIPSANGPFELESESVMFHIGEPAHVGAYAALGGGIFVLLSVFVALLWRRKNRLSAKAKQEKRDEDALAEQFLLLKKRVAKADSRMWLLDLEKICKSWAMRRFGNDNLEDLAKNGLLDGWQPLLNEFAHARYGGGERDAFQNKESWKTASKLLNIQEDE